MTQSTHSRDAFPTKQLAILALCRVAEPIAMCSIFPYVFPQVKSFLKDDHSVQSQSRSHDNIGIYTGLIISSFAFAECLTSCFWGWLSDKIGRKPVLIIGLCGTFTSLQIYGFATSLWMAVLGRALGGILNGNVGVMQTIVAEIINKKEHQARAFSILPMTWCIGSVLGPAIGGALAQPTKYWPSAFPPGSLFDRFPWALPNIACGVLVGISMILAIVCLEETNQKVTTKPVTTTDEIACLLSNSPRHGYNTMTSSARSDALEYFPEKCPGSAYNGQVILYICSFGALSYHANAYEHLLPILLQSSPSPNAFNFVFFTGGFGFTSQLLGLLYTSQGLFAIFTQFAIFPTLTTKLSVHKLYVFLVTTYPLLYMFTPYIVLLSSPYYWPALILSLIVKVVWECGAFTSLFILLTNAVSCQERMGSVNGLAASVAGLTKAIGPSLSGLIFDKGIAIDCAGLAWWFTAIIAAAGAVLCLWLQDGNDDELPGSDWVVDYFALDSESKMESTVSVCEIVLPNKVTPLLSPSIQNESSVRNHSTGANVNVIQPAAVGRNGYVRTLSYNHNHK